jgi:hypothetical protein
MGCGPRSSTHGNGDAGSNGNDNTADGGGGSGDGSGEYDAAICQEDEFSIQALPPNLLIMLDRSGSMDNPVPNSSGNRWDVSCDAIRQVVTDFDTVIRFGLATYSSCLPGGCSAGAIRVPIADNNSGPIIGFLDPLAGEGSWNGQQINGQGKVQYLCDSGDPETTTGSSLQAMVGEPSLADTDRENAILLLTDGEESGSCVQGGVNGSVAAGNLFAQNPPVKTYAVGFMGANVGELQAIATAGGTTQPYFADQAQELHQALQTIAADVVSCEYALPGLDPNADPNQVNFYFDGQLVGYDDGCQVGTGWTWVDPNHTMVRFCQDACDRLKDHLVNTVTATFGCLTEPVR